jgi:hypothetical protein
MNKHVWALALGVLLWLPGQAAAVDPWETGAGDDGAGTDNELASGSEQQHDLDAAGSGVQDQDWYLVGQQPYSSYEVIADGLTEPIANMPVGTDPTRALQVDLVNSGGTIQNSGYAFSSLGSARTLRFRNTTATEVTNEFIRIRTGTNSQCTTTCTSAAQYRILFRETTLMAPRFNNSGTQTTVIMLQNAGRDEIDASVRYWGTTGTLLGTSNVTIQPRGVAIIQSGTVPNVGGQAGSVTIDHTGRYGNLSGKAVALEPSTGFTFDTMFLPKFM